MLSLFTTKKKTPSYRKVSALDLKQNDTCYYGGHSSPFKVVEASFTSKGLQYIEIKNEKSGKKYLFTDNTTVLVQIND